MMSRSQVGKFLINQKTCLSTAGAEEIRLWFLECIDYVKRWKSVTVEFDDNIDDIACGFILSSLTTVTVEPISLRCNLCINMITERKNTLRNSTEMTACYEKDDEIKKVLATIYKDEYKITHQIKWFFWRSHILNTTLIATHGISPNIP